MSRIVSTQNMFESPLGTQLSVLLAAMLITLVSGRDVLFARSQITGWSG